MSGGEEQRDHRSDAQPEGCRHGRLLSSRNQRGRVTHATPVRRASSGGSTGGLGKREDSPPQVGLLDAVRREGQRALVGPERIRSAAEAAQGGGAGGVIEGRDIEGGRGR